MSDYLVNLSRKPVVRQTVQSLGLPVPMPQALRRPKGSWLLRPLSGRLVAHAADPKAELHERVLDTIGSLGASAIAGASLGDEKVHGLVFDASGVVTIADLEAVYAFFHDTIRQLDRCGRVVVIGRPPSEAPSAEAAAARHALEGFTRSLAKEIGRKGATAVLLEVGRGVALDQGDGAGQHGAVAGQHAGDVFVVGQDAASRAGGRRLGRGPRLLCGQSIVAPGHTGPDARGKGFAGVIGRPFGFAGLRIGHGVGVAAS